MLDLLAGAPLLLLFVVIGVGFLAGSIRVFGFSLGPSAVLFTGIFFGALDPRFRIPDLVYVLGLILFVYTIGLQSGPSFFASFGRRALRANMLAVAVLVLAAALAVGGKYWFGLDGASATGVFCGALTNTPALAAAVESVKALTAGGDPATTKTLANAPVVAYSVCYPFGVIGVLLGFYVFGLLRRKPREGEREADRSMEPSAGPILARTYRVVNPGVIGKSVSSVLAFETAAGFVLSRIRRGTTTTLVYGDTVLQRDDLLVAVGPQEAHERALVLFGEESSHDIHTENEEFDFRRIEVSDHRVVGKTIGELNMQKLLDATITRIRRGDVDFVPSGETILERGDRVRILTWTGNMPRVARFFGDSVKASSETDFLSLSIGIVAGVLLGMVPLPLPGGSTFALGFAGGPLIAGLILGRVQKSGPILWTMPFSVNLTLRQVGLVLFLAGIGTKAGDRFLETVAAGGWHLMLAGAIITASVTLVALALGSRLLGLSVPAAMGLMSGVQTQPACLAYANERSSSNAPNIWYASVYPASMIAKIILAQLLVGRLLF
jgi:putative transport protein